VVGLSMVHDCPLHRCGQCPQEMSDFARKPRQSARNPVILRTGIRVAGAARMKTSNRSFVALASLLAAPFLLGAQGDGCAASSRSPAPDVSGRWEITYDDSFEVEIRIGGAVYTEQL